MFDPSFFELIVICIVALLVLGPDRLPGAIKTCGLWIGRLRRSFNNIKREIEQEVGADEIRRQLRNEDIMEKFKNTKSQITESIDSVKDDLNLKKTLTEFGDDKSESESTSAGNSDLPFNQEQAATSEDADDPIEKLATNDPSAKVSPAPEQQTAGKVKPESDIDTNDSSTSVAQDNAAQDDKVNKK